MKGWLLTALVVAVVLVASLPALGLKLPSDRPHRAPEQVVQVRDDGGSRDGLARGHRFGPPPWARGQGLSSARPAREHHCTRPTSPGQPRRR